jgi:hypothetical protein
MTFSMRSLAILLLASATVGCTLAAPAPVAPQPGVRSQARARTGLSVTSLTAWPDGLAPIQSSEQQAFITWARQSNPGIIAMAFQGGTTQRSIQRLSAEGRTLGYYVGITGTATEVDEFGQMEAAFVQGFLYDDALQPLVWMGSAYDVNEAQPPRQAVHPRRRSRSGFEVVGSADAPEILQRAKARTQHEHATWLKSAQAGLFFKPVTSMDPVPCIELRLDGAPLGWFTTAHTQGFDSSRIVAGFAFADWLAADGTTIAGTLARLSPFKPAESRFVPLSR